MADSKKYAAAKAAKQAKRFAASNCPRAGGCKCHAGSGLNVWVQSCPMCGCFNPRFDIRAQSPIENPLDAMRRQLGL